MRENFLSLFKIAIFVANLLYRPQNRRLTQSINDKKKKPAVYLKNAIINLCCLLLDYLSPTVPDFYPKTGVLSI